VLSAQAGAVHKKVQNWLFSSLYRFKRAECDIFSVSVCFRRFWGRKHAKIDPKADRNLHSLFPKRKTIRDYSSELLFKRIPL
jgi:hypothetical protein